jgi:hypothetical protein
MLSEKRIIELSIRWYFLALLAKTESIEKAAGIFSKAHAFIHVLGLPASIQCGKKSEEGIKLYAQGLLTKFSTETKGNTSPDIGEWLSNNVNVEFEQFI